VRLAGAFGRALGAAVAILAMGDLALGNLTVGTFTRGSADRRLRDRAGRGISAFIKAEPGARLARRRGTSLFRSVGSLVMKKLSQQRIAAGLPMIPVPKADPSPATPAGRCDGNLG